MDPEQSMIVSSSGTWPSGCRDSRGGNRVQRNAETKVFQMQRGFISKQKLPVLSSPILQKYSSCSCSEVQLWPWLACLAAQTHVCTLMSTPTRSRAHTPLHMHTHSPLHTPSLLHTLFSLAHTHSHSSPVHSSVEVWSQGSPVLQRR